MRFIVVFALFLSVGCSDFTYGRQVDGKIATEAGSRFGKISPSSDSGNQQKFSIKLFPVIADSTVTQTAGGPHGVIIECLSTRCAQVQPGECHRFECKYNHRWWEPDVIGCKHVKEIECPKWGI